MRQIAFQMKMEALELYLQGFSADKIVDKTGISKGAVVSIIRDAREGKFPELALKDRIDELHSLSVRLRKGETDVNQAKLGFTFFKRLLSIGIEPDKVKDWAEFCSEISPTPSEGFVPSAMEFSKIEKETGKSYADIAAEVKELSIQRNKLVEEVGDLSAKEKKARRLEVEAKENEDRAVKLRTDLANLEARTSTFDRLLRKRADGLGISFEELEAKLRELVYLEEEIASRRKEKNRLEGEIEALAERQERLSSRLEKASVDFEKDAKLIRAMTDEIVQIAEMKGKYEKEIAYMKWAESILPFLSDPDKVDDEDFSLISIVVNCVDKWFQSQPQWRYRRPSTWYEVKSYVQSKREKLIQSSH